MKYERVTIEDYIKELSGKKEKYRALYDLWKMVNEGKLKIEDPDKPITFASYLFRLDYTMWFWTSILLIIMTLISIYLTEWASSVIFIRYVLGTIYVLFIPGYALVEALYPREETLNPLERVALSIGLSLAIVPIIGLVLNYTPWGIRLVPIIISITVYNFIVLIIATYRKYLLSKLK
ncbi:MAG: DUF1616 domain-containing protein [Desulfurococcaceae archaeon]